MKDLIKIIAICWLHLFLSASSKNVPLSTKEDLNHLFPFFNTERRSEQHDPKYIPNGDDVGERLILTKYIEEGKLKEAREAAAVPKDHLLKNIDSYAGYFTVNKKYNGNLFFWYFPVMGLNVEETPLLIWLQGGPGASSLFGLFSEIGPFYLDSNKTLQEMQYSWGKNHSLLFIDNPIGTGYSFVDKDGYATNQTTIGENLYDGLQQFLTIFSELRKAPLIITGESYAGKHIPSLAIQIHRNKNNDEKSPINLQGLAIGNGFMDPKSLLVYSYFAREVGLIDDYTAEILRSTEESAIKHIDEGNTELATGEWNYVLSQISRGINTYNYLSEQKPDNYFDFIRSNEIRKIIHVGNTEYVNNNYEVIRNLSEDFMRSAKHWVEELIQNYKVMCYNGHLDIIVAYHPSVNTYSQFKYPGSEQYKTAKRSPWFHGERLAGFVKTVGNFSDVMVRGAGHMVPTDQPAAALGMITAFARGIPLTQNTGNLSPL